MKNSRGIVWGGLLIILGTLWLLRSMNLLNINWDEVLPYWPVLLILAGAVLLATGRERGSGGVVGLLITLAVFGAIVNRTDRAFDRHGNNWNFGWDDDDDDHDYGRMTTTTMIAMMRTTMTMTTMIRMTTITMNTRIAMEKRRSMVSTNMIWKILSRKPIFIWKAERVLSH
jgi:hypothetical protein